MVEQDRERFVAKLREIADAIEELSWDVELPLVEFMFFNVDNLDKLEQLGQFLSDECEFSWSGCTDWVSSKTEFQDTRIATSLFYARHLKNDIVNRATMIEGLEVSS